MDAIKQFDIQRQVRNNNEDFQNYARELKLWETEMKRKDKELSDQSGKKDVPPIRKKLKKESSNANAVKPGRISAFDYSSWDKFDVDKACEEMDADDSDEEEDTDVEEEDLDRIATAVYHKEQGNKLVKEGKWGEAIEKYNVAIQTYPLDAVFYANRALCFLNMRNYVSAEADCTSSLKLDNTYVKAYLRRASARRALSRFAEARSDILKVLQLEPNNKQAETELSELCRKLDIPLATAADSAQRSSKQNKWSPNTSSPAKTPQTAAPSSGLASGGAARQSSNRQCPPPDLSWAPAYDSSVYSVTPRHFIPPHQRSKKLLMKVNIEPESTNTSVASPESTNTSVATTCTRVIEDRTGKLQITDDEEEVVTLQDSGDLLSDGDRRRKKLELLESAWNELQNANPYRKSSDEDESVEQRPAVSVKPECQAKPVCQAVSTVVIPGAPKTCSQFELHWRTLKSSEESLYLYLKQIPGHELPSIFKEGLETYTFLDIVRCLGRRFIENGDVIAEYVQGLAKTPRLASIVMLMTQTEKSMLSKLLQYCEEKKHLEAAELQQLIQTFEL